MYDRIKKELSRLTEKQMYRALYKVYLEHSDEPMSFKDHCAMIDDYYDGPILAFLREVKEECDSGSFAGKFSVFNVMPKYVQAKLLRLM